MLWRKHCVSPQAWRLGNKKHLSIPDPFGPAVIETQRAVVMSCAILADHLCTEQAAGQYCQKQRGELQLSDPSELFCVGTAKILLRWLHGVGVH